MKIIKFSINHIRNKVRILHIKTKKKQNLSKNLADKKNKYYQNIEKQFELNSVLETRAL